MLELSQYTSKELQQELDRRSRHDEQYNIEFHSSIPNFRFVTYGLRISPTFSGPPHPEEIALALMNIDETFKTIKNRVEQKGG